MHKFIRFNYSYEIRDNALVLFEVFSRSRKALKSIKSGKYAIVGVYDEQDRLYMMQLRYNQLRRKYYLCSDSTKLFRYKLSKYQAFKLLSITIYSKILAIAIPDSTIRAIRGS